MKHAYPPPYAEQGETTMIDKKQLDTMTLDEVMTAVPTAAEILRRYNLDLCCSGGMHLRDVLTRKDIDYDHVLDALSAPPASAKEARAKTAESSESVGFDPSLADNATLISHIITRYHDRHRHQLPSLIQLASRVEKVHEKHPHCPKGLEALLEKIFSELTDHMQKEERILFPLLKNGTKADAEGPIAVMKEDHEDQIKAVSHLREITHNGVLPPEACRSWTSLYEQLAAFEEDLAEHIRIENEILFAR
jgi:regulator of cell morphogenesis and NO signaling